MQAALCVRLDQAVTRQRLGRVVAQTIEDPVIDTPFVEPAQHFRTLAIETASAKMPAPITVALEEAQDRRREGCSER
jgi:hypothetical protein